MISPQHPQARAGAGRPDGGLGRAAGPWRAGAWALAALASGHAARAEAPDDTGAGAPAAPRLGPAPLPLPEGFTALEAGHDRLVATHHDGTVLLVERHALRRPLAAGAGLAEAEAEALRATLGPEAALILRAEQRVGDALQLRYTLSLPGGAAEAELRWWAAATHSLRARWVVPTTRAASAADHPAALLAALSGPDLPAAATPPLAAPTLAGCAPPPGYAPLFDGEQGLIEAILNERSPPAACAWAAERPPIGPVALLRWCDAAPRAASAAHRLATGEGAVWVEAWALSGPAQLRAVAPPTMRCPPPQPRLVDRLRAAPGAPMMGLGAALMALSAGLLGWAKRGRRR